jgi:hydrogenase nickel incorporation protein HypA/HybF
VHERALISDLVRKVEDVARVEGAERVTRVEVRFGTLSHFTPAHFRDHFEDAARGTVAEGADVDAVLDEGLTGERAAGVVLVGVEIAK